MNLPLPATFNAELMSDRLEAVSQWLLDELYATEDDLSRPTDSGLHERVHYVRAPA